MKKLLIPVFLCFVYFSQAQSNQLKDILSNTNLPIAELIDSAEKVISENEEENEVEEDGDAVHLNRWKEFWSIRNASDPQSENGTIHESVKKYAEYFDALTSNCNEPDLSCSSGNWSSIGPDDQGYHTGRIQSIWVQPSDPNYVLAGGHSGGIFKCTNAMSGNPTWVNITDNSRFSGQGINWIDANSDASLIYAGTGTDLYATYGFGLIKSSDAGQTWCLVLPTTLSNGSTQVRKVLIDPQDEEHVVAITDNELFYTYDGGTTWHNVGFSANNGNTYPGLRLTDFEFVPNNPNTFICSGNKLYLVQISTVTTVTDLIPQLTPLSSSLSSNEFIRYYDIKISIPTENYNSTYPYIYVYYSRGTCTTFGNCYSGKEFGIDYCQTNTITQPWTNVSLIVHSSHTTIDRTTAVFEVNNLASYDNPTIYLENSGRDLAKSMDGGNCILQYNVNYTHDDIRSIILYDYSPNADQDLVFVAHDGGISLYQPRNSPNLICNNSNFYLANDVDLSGPGLICNQFNGFGGSEKMPDIIYGGAQDNAHFRKFNGSWTYFLAGSGDGYDCISDKSATPNIILQGYLDSSVRIVESNNGFGTVIQPSTAGGTDFNGALLTLFNRRMKNGIDTDKILYGQDKIFSIDLSTSSCLTTAVSPADPSGEGKLIISYAQSKATPDLAFITYRGPNWWDGTPAGYLYRSTDFTHPVGPNQTWTSISENLGNTNGNPIESCSISDVLIIHEDATIPAKVYISFYDFSQQANTNRVLESTDGGLNWHDFSTGLTIFPVHELVYQEGSDGLIYAATDVGIFYRYTNDPSATWACFNNGLPHGINNDIEINVCANILRTSLFGKGIWETDLMPPRREFVISTQNDPFPHWSGTVDLYSDLRIETGCSLTISGVLNMAKGKRIFIEREAALILDGGTITNGCGKMWGGIIMEDGDPTQPQLSSGQALDDYHGTLILKNNALIENAITAVYAKNGARIFANGSTIQNCRWGVDIQPYDAPGHADNRCSFVNCRFVCDDVLADHDLYPNLGSANFLKMYKVRGVMLNGNTFICTYNFSPPTLPMGIFAFDAILNITSANHFENLSIGFFYGSWFSSWLIQKNCVFDNCRIGNYIVCAASAYLYNNTYLNIPINTDNSSTTSFGTTGIAVFSGLGSKLLKNHFTAEPGNAEYRDTAWNMDEGNRK